MFCECKSMCSKSVLVRREEKKKEKKRGGEGGLYTLSPSKTTLRDLF